MASAKLNQIVAVEKGVKNDGNRVFNEAYKALQAEGPQTGMSRTYQPRRDDGDTLPAEHVKVQYTANEKLAEIGTALTRVFNVTATKDFGNAIAQADVVVDGDTLIADAPPTLLLTLEKYLMDLKTVISKAAVLDPSIDWDDDPNSGLFRSEPVKTIRTRKTPKAHVLYEATDRHPAQVESFTVDEVIGDYTAVKFSGALTVSRRDFLVGKVTKLLQAVKFAREQANSTVVEDQNVGDAIFGYLLAE
jgi:hypothetical protein